MVSSVQGENKTHVLHTACPYDEQNRDTCHQTVLTAVESGATKWASSNAEGLKVSRANHQRYPVQRTSVIDFLRTIAASVSVWSCAISVAAAMFGKASFGLTMCELGVLFAIGFTAYVYELSKRKSFWAVACPRCAHSDGSMFASKVAALRDAEPCIELCAGDSAPIPYRIAEWTDETRPVEPDGFAGAPKGLFIVTFPLQFIPGNDSEAAALEHARTKLTSTIELGSSDKDCQRPLCDPNSEDTTVHMRLKWPDGSESNTPLPCVLADGGEARMAQALLLLSIPCLLALVADIVLQCSLTPLVWPVRKRFFTLKGMTELGTVCFLINSSSGKVTLLGDEETLLRANEFWLAPSAWKVLWDETHSTASCVARFVFYQRIACLVAGVAAAAATFMIINVVRNADADQAVRVAALSGAGSAAFFLLCAGILSCFASCHMQRCGARLKTCLNGSVDVRVSQSDQYSSDTYMVTVKQIVDEKLRSNTVTSSVVQKMDLVSTVSIGADRPKPSTGKGALCEEPLSTSEWTTEAPSNSQWATSVPSSRADPDWTTHA